MWVVFILAVLGTAHSSPLATKTVDITDVVTTNNYLLPQESSPTFYDLQLFLNPENPQNFTGSVSIRILPNVPTSQFVLQAQDMTVSRIQVFKADELDVDLFSQYSQAADDTHFLTISLNSTVLPLVPYVVNIDYVGSYATDMFGLYVSSYQQNSQTINLITSQLQPTYARRAFPCYDQPGIKAIFRTTIYAPPTRSYTVVRTNMPARSDSLKPDVAGYTKHEFQDTLVMSTYLLAFLVSNFNFIENNQPNPIYNKPFRVYSRPGTQDTAEFALDFGQKNMVALENYTDFPYAFPKMDKAAVPDFAAGAMENWGLVIYREAALLVQDGVTTTSSKQGIARIITHENTHQWYGNEVSPVTWTYTWLNEGFANFFESFGTELVLPEWRMMDQMLLGVQNVFQNDAVLSVNPMTYEVNTPSEVIGTFNAVAYQKSGSVIRMMQHFLTPEVFRDGLNLYLKRYSRDSTVPMDLFTALQEALNNSPHSIPYQVQTIMDRWTNQGGFPVIEVLKNAPEANSVSVKQERYLTDPSLSSNYLWHVPLNWVLSSNPDFSNTAPQAWLGPTSSAGNINIPNLAEASWYIVNKQQTGYYRVNYDEDNWVALANVLSSSPNTIHLLNRAQIIDDSFNLARTGRLDYKHPLEISRYLKNEDDYIPWGAASNALNYLDSVLSGSEAYAPFQAYVLDLAAASYEKLGFNADTNSEEHVTPFYRNIILDFYCRYGNEHCVQTAQELLQGVRNNTIQNLNPDVQNTVFCSGLRGGDSDNFNFVWDRYLASDDPTEKSMLLSSLGCTSNSELRDFFLNQVIDDNSQVREQDRHSVIVAVISASTENMDAALDFVVENFDKIQPRVQGLSGTSNILTAFARRLNTQEHMTKIDELERLHGSIFTASENAGVTAIKENIAASISWGNDNMANVEAWLRDNYGEPGSANAISASIIVAISVVVMIFNF